MKTSIIVLTFNNLEFNKKCIGSVLDSTLGDFELIVVDNASNDGTQEYLKEIQNEKVKVILNKENLGFSKGNNQGAEEATGEILVFLNNDTEVRKDWLSPLLEQLKRKDVGIVAPKLLYPDGKLQHAGIVISDKHIPRHVYRRFGSGFAPANKLREYKAVTGACLVIKKEIWGKAKGFDERYINGLEDVDLCLKTRELGYKVLYVPQSTVIHHESLSKDRFAHVFRNIEIFLGRWEEVEPDEDETYRQDGFGSLFIFEEHFKNRYLTGNYKDKITLLLKRAIQR